jgi:hypothetical protein
MSQTAEGDVHAVQGYSQLVAALPAGTCQRLHLRSAAQGTCIGFTYTLGEGEATCKPQTFCSWLLLCQLAPEAHLLPPSPLHQTAPAPVGVPAVAGS